MKTFIITLCVMGGAVALMAIGVIISNLRIKGTCGGLNRAIGEKCSTCGRTGDDDCLD